MADYEHIPRFQNETVRQFANRYVRVEKDLAAIGISTSSMYDSESRGNRLLDRSRLTPDLQRLVLIGAGNSLDFERVRDSLNFQFPDFKPSPPVAGSQGSSGKSKGKGSNAPSSSLSSSTASNSSSFSPSSSSSYRSLSQGKYPRRVYQTGHGDELQQIPEESADL